VQYFLLVAFSALVLNFLAAVVLVLRRARRGSWLLVLLLSSTTGAAMAVMAGLLFAELDERSVDVALAFTGLASVSALVAVVVFLRRGGAEPAGVGEQDAV
jgi:4-amino-4-deoxy-L-arabinose transferase-like glycosyltransferase